MRFAKVDGLLKEAESGEMGLCRGCQQPVIAKCGNIRVHHWAHQNTKMCDHWWEPETEWHRAWKNNFPQQWQEIFMPDPRTGEKHIADVLTEHGLILEFQHSKISPKERLSREQFYQNMVWIVDRTGLKKDYTRLVKGHTNWQPTDQANIYRYTLDDECFPPEWLNTTVPVVFDFQAPESADDPLGLTAPLYCIFPVQIGRAVEFAKVSRSSFIKSVIEGGFSARMSNHINKLNAEKKNWEVRMEATRLKLQLEDLAAQRLRNDRKPGRRRF